MTDNIINTQPNISKIRPNLWQLTTGHVVGFGTLLAPGGQYYCFTCNAAGCQHTQTVDEAWTSGDDSALADYQVPTTSGYHAPSAVTAPPFTLLEVSAADIQAVNAGTRPGAWKARSREELPSGWPNTRVLL